MAKTIKEMAKDKKKPVSKVKQTKASPKAKKTPVKPTKTSNKRMGEPTNKDTLIDFLAGQQGDLSLSEYAENLGTNKHYLCAILNGTRFISVEGLVRFINELGYDVDLVVRKKK